MWRQINIFLDRTRTDLRIRRALAAKKWVGNGNIKVLFVSEGNRISKSQIYPYYYYSKQISKKQFTEFRQLDIAKIYSNAEIIPENVDIIFFQPFFGYDIENSINILELLKQKNPKSKVVFFDVSAPLDLRFASILNSKIDLYVKKHIFKDRTRYGQATQGDTNLVEYCEQHYSLAPSRRTLFEVPTSFLSKIVVGPNFFTSREMLPILKSERTPISRRKKYDLHARLGVKGLPWYQAMREHALSMCIPYSNRGIVTSESVSNRQYMIELSESRICFSPFGYGEVCWRDYEAVLCGAMLIKPDMSHVETSPDIFIPYESYVPVAWDYSDLHDKLEYYLANSKERERIVSNAYLILHDYTIGNAFNIQSEILFK